MSEHTGIEWTDHTFNIAWGCMKVSPGCTHCYADLQSRRYGFDVWGPAATTERRTFGAKHWDDPIAWNRKAEREGVRKRVFCSSMCDVFEDHPTIDREREKLWPLIRATPWLDWQLLTKRPERIAANLPDDWGEGYANVWLGTSVESQEYVVERIPALLMVSARVRFLSCEPLLGPVDLQDYLPSPWGCGGSSRNPDCEECGLSSGIGWVIVGGESGPKCRPMDPEWAGAIQDQCWRAGVAFFLKQLGGFPDKRGHDAASLDGVRYMEMPIRNATATDPGNDEGRPEPRIAQETQTQ